MTLTISQAINIFREAGFPEETLVTVVAIAMGESSLRPDVVNKNDKTGDLSYGLMQVNMKGTLGPARRAKYNLASNEDLKDPATNARVAFDLSSRGMNWLPWGAYKNGSYKQYLAQVQVVFTQNNPVHVARCVQMDGDPGGHVYLVLESGLAHLSAPDYIQHGAPTVEMLPRTDPIWNRPRIVWYG